MQALSQLPSDILEKEIITSKLNLGDIYSLCQGFSKIIRRCNSKSFWKKIGEEKYPELTSLLPGNINSIIAVFYRDLAKFMYYLSQLLQKTPFEMSFQRFNISDEGSRILKSLGYLFLKDMANIDIRISKYDRNYLVIYKNPSNYTIRREGIVELNDDALTIFLALLFIFSDSNLIKTNIESFNQLYDAYTSFNIDIKGQII